MQWFSQSLVNVEGLSRFNRAPLQPNTNPYPSAITNAKESQFHRHSVRHLRTWQYAFLHELSVGHACHCESRRCQHEDEVLGPASGQGCHPRQNQVVNMEGGAVQPSKRRRRVVRRALRSHRCSEGGEWRVASRFSRNSSPEFVNETNLTSGTHESSEGSRKIVIGIPEVSIPRAE